MIFINKNNQFAMSLQKNEDINTMEVFDDYVQQFLTALMIVLMHGDLKKLKKFAKKNPVVMSRKFAALLFVYAMDKVKLGNLMWLDNYLGVYFVDYCDLRTASITSVEDAFIPNLIGASFIYKPDYALMISNLKNMGINLNQQYMDGFTLLHFLSTFHGSAREAHKDAIRALLDNGADPNIKNAYNETALKYADNEEIANYLIQQDECKPAFKYTKTNKSVAISSTEFRNKQIYQFCLQHGGVESAISRIERELIANTIPVARNSSMNNPAPRRI